MEVDIEYSWKIALKELFNKPYFNQIADHLKAERAPHKTIYPSGPQIFNAFSLTPFDQVKVILLGQDPYHNPNQAMGLSFSVPNGIKTPPSLVNIFKELNKDIGMPIPNSGNLTHWAEQGVLLLNAVLTVRENEPASHAKIGWTEFTNDVIRLLSLEKKDLVFILWGNFAQEKIKLIDSSKHKILKAAHPSPFSAYNGFFGCKHFSTTNEYLVQHNKNPIDWSV
jgi:uracil-DNA glycosylase